MSAHPVQWQSPQPLWARFGAARATAAAAPDQLRPSIFRFATDEFMQQMLGTLMRDPSQLGTLLVRPETWRNPGAADDGLVERVPVPRLAQGAARRVAAARTKQLVPATVSSAQIVEQQRSRTVPLKLYQPVHQRFYLVGGTLVCATPGLPERAVTPGNAETVHFVIRRLLPATPNGAITPESLREFAFIKDASGARWQRVGSDEDAQQGGAQLAAGEEPLALFPLAFKDDANRARTLWTGLVPVGRREEYMSTAPDWSRAPSLTQGQIGSMADRVPPALQPSTQARLTQFKFEVAEPWKVLVRSAFSTSAGLTATPPDGLSGNESTTDKIRRTTLFNLQQQMTSWLILLDFADYLAAYLPDVWTAIDDNGASAAGLSTRQRTLYDWLGNARMSAGLISAAPGKAAASSLRAALKAIRTDAVRNGLESSTLIYGTSTAAEAVWPGFHFLLAGVDNTRQPAGPFLDVNLLPTSTEGVDPEPAGGAPIPPAQTAAQGLDRLTALIGRALDVRVETDAPPLPFAVQVQKSLQVTAGDEGWFVVRFVYARRDCGPLHPPVLSAATQRFQLASFFDVDAPARPIRITLPTDTSAAGLRKYNKNTAFVLSDMLCGQVQRAKGLGLIDLVLSVLPWPLHKDLDVGDGGPCQSGGNSIGMICSLSIPIITICALILLIIIVTLLDLIFRWLPFFVICFPVPGLKGKKGG